MSTLQDVRVATLQHALAALAEEGLVVLRQGRTAVVAGDVVVDRRAARAARGRDHDCKRAGCQPHVCSPLTAKTIRNVHAGSTSRNTGARSATAAEGPPRCGTTPTPYLRSTGEPPPISHS